jgi:hypothetical protein
MLCVAMKARASEMSRDFRDALRPYQGIHCTPSTQSGAFSDACASTSYLFFLFAFLAGMQQKECTPYIGAGPQTDCVCSHCWLAKSALHMQVSQSVVSKWMNRLSTSPYFERCAPRTLFIKRILHQCLRVSLFQSICSLRNPMKQAIWCEVSVRLIRMTITRHARTRERAHFCGRPSCVQQQTIDSALRRKRLPQGAQVYISLDAN